MANWNVIKLILFMLGCFEGILKMHLSLSESSWNSPSLQEYAKLLESKPWLLITWWCKSQDISIYGRGLIHVVYSVASNRMVNFQSIDQLKPLFVANYLINRTCCNVVVSITYGILSVPLIPNSIINTRKRTRKMNSQHPYKLYAVY